MRAVTKHTTGTRDEWLAARLELLEAEKELTRRSDELARRRQELPWVRVDKEYRFETDEGSASLADLFRGRSQLLVYHFMFGPDYTAGCPACSAIADGVDVPLGVLVRQRLQLRLQRRVHRGATARGRHRIQLPARGGVAVGRRRGARRRNRGHDRNRHSHVHAREAGHERVRARGRCRLPHL